MFADCADVADDEMLTPAAFDPRDHGCDEDMLCDYDDDCDWDSNTDDPTLPVFDYGPAIDDQGDDNEDKMDQWLRQGQDVRS